MCIDRTGIAKIIIIPDIIQNTLSGQRYTLIVDKISKELKLLVAELDVFAIDLDLMGCLIQHNASNLLNALFEGIGTAKDCFHTRHKDLWTKRLGHILIHAQIKPLQLILLVTFSGQHNDRHLRIFADLTAYLPSVHLWHHNIQNDQSDILIGIKQVHCFLSIAGFHHFKILLHQKVTDKLAHSLLIIHNQYL